MYQTHFGLHAQPFALTPDTDFAYTSQSHQVAFNTLRVALDAGEGFVKITGEVGTGKTLLCRCLLQWLAGHSARFVTAYLPNPRLTPRQFAHALAAELQLPLPVRADERSAFARVERALIEHASQGRTVVLLVDEAQAMPVAALESLRLLSNLETGKRRLLQVVLFGQPELDEQLLRRELRSLASRIAFGAQLAPLGFADFQQYLRHRLGVAGWRGGAVWSLPARWWLWRTSGGVPRTANLLAHKSLMLAYAAGQSGVALAQARAAAQDHALPRPGFSAWAWWRALALALARSRATASA